MKQLEELCNDVQRPTGERLSQTYSKYSDLYYTLCCLKVSSEKKIYIYDIYGVLCRPPWKTGDLSLEEQVLQNTLSSVRDEPIVLLLHWTQGWDSETQESILLPWKNNEGDWL